MRIEGRFEVVRRDFLRSDKAMSRQEGLWAWEKAVSDETQPRRFIALDDSEQEYGGDPYLVLEAADKFDRWGELMRVVLTMAGYKLSMWVLLDDSDPGLARRAIWGQDGNLKIDKDVCFSARENKLDESQEMREMGFRNLEGLPEQIDVQDTVDDFLEQVRRRDYSRPSLVLPSGERV